ncbi:MAG: T9SS type A sorting domain-containing protein, partial [Calditrichota bacterium]
RRSLGGGAYRLENIPLGEHTVHLSFGEYLPFEQQINLEEEGEVVLNIPLLHSICQFDREDIQAELPNEGIGDITMVEFTASNPGNGPLTYHVERRLIGEFEADPWERRSSFNASAALGNDSRIGGVVFANDRYYISADNRGNPSIHVFSREGQLLQTFEQPGQAVYGMQDLAWDGELIWGGSGHDLFGFTLNGEESRSFRAPPNPITSVAWDPDLFLLWVSGTTVNISGMDINGQVVTTLNRRGLRIYGLAYWPEDPDGYCLYIFNNQDGNSRTVHKMNTQTNDTLRVLELPALEGGRPNAAFITNQLDVYSWVFLAMINNAAEDRLDVWQLDTRRDWMQINPDAGVIEAGEEQAFELTLSAVGFPVVLLEGELAFHHDGLGRETVLPVTLNVVEPGPVERVLDLREGWSMISFNVVPEDDDIRTIFQPLVDNDALIMLKDGLGRFYRPEFNFLNIPHWEFSEGYQIRMAEPMQLAMRGNVIPNDQAIALVARWQIVAYYPRFHAVAPLAFANIVEVLTIAKDDVGHFYLPAFGFNNMEPLHEGAGYQVNVTQAVDLVWGRLDERGLNPQYNPPQADFPVSPSPYNMSVLALTDPGLTGELEVYAGGREIGCGQITDGACGIAVWGDDPATEEIEGAQPGEALTLRLKSGETLSPLETNDLLGSGIYATDGIWVVRLTGGASSPSDYELLTVYPNPFNSRTIVNINLNTAGKVRLDLVDARGCVVETIHQGEASAGRHSFALDAEDLPSGIYLARLTSPQGTMCRKVVVMK